MENFWETKSLGEMNHKEWESLCDHCAKCCLLKLEDDDTGDIYYTAVSCRYLDTTTCACTEYKARLELVPDCIRLTPDNIDSFKWLPDTCAYRLLAEKKPLPEWHPLISGNPLSVFDAGVSVRDRVIQEDYVHEEDLTQYIIKWVD